MLYYKRHKDECKARSLKRRRENKDKVKDIQKKYAQSHKEKVREINKRYRDRHPLHTKKAFDAWAIKNPRKAMLCAATGRMATAIIGRL